MSSPEAKKTLTRSSRPSPARATPRACQARLWAWSRRLRQRPAVVAEALLDGLDDLDGVVGEVADHLPQSEADQLDERGHGASPPAVDEEPQGL